MLLTPLQDTKFTVSFALLALRLPGVCGTIFSSSYFNITLTSASPRLLQGPRRRQQGRGTEQSWNICQPVALQVDCRTNSRLICLFIFDNDNIQLEERLDEL